MKSEDWVVWLTKDLLACSGKGPGHAAGAHGTGNGDNLVKGDVTAVLDWKINQSENKKQIKNYEDIWLVIHHFNIPDM